MFAVREKIKTRLNRSTSPRYLRLIKTVRKLKNFRMDLFLFDYKVTDPDKHKALCGVNNSTILKNFEYVYSKGKDIILRLPLIPGVNDTPDHFDGIAEIMKSHPRILKSEIMPYHTFGIGKTEELGKRPDENMPVTGATNEDVSIWLEELHKRGVENVCRS